MNKPQFLSDGCRPYSIVWYIAQFTVPTLELTDATEPVDPARNGRHARRGRKTVGHAEGKSDDDR